MSDVLPAVEIEPSARTADRSVIWLHGLGASGHDFEPIVPELGLPADAAVRFVFPHAPVQPVTINGGMPMPAWYDIKQLGGGNEDEVGIRASEREVQRLIRRENERGVPTERIVLAGFSQGGAIVLHTGLRYPERLAGIMALSTYLPLNGSLEAERHAGNHQTPIFMAHGTLDPVVPYQNGARSRDLLNGQDHPVEWHEYPMEHQVCLEQIQDIGAWLKRVLAL
ncbi:carboxylesterase [Alkalilimnicola ehrlichii]|uniref:Carboxylesterase n=1 Tax=Alkalilimnicola ehrlichii TaxID=351052 RepID=A0A3E0X1W2_9GAMM|nr:alpha/beta hydrolase-fold protein [Alkalilimnicola ehrlichii]RFA30693.1 carboxylesterase [Alkalilimnicola ehrlichii]RFA38271.1 carboxylesterase [Alkalilimnicola ehrlichii]